MWSEKGLCYAAQYAPTVEGLGTVKVKQIILGYFMIYDMNLPFSRLAFNLLNKDDELFWYNADHCA
jgi:hypothetical protein